MSNEAVMTFGYSGLVPWCPFSSRTKSCFAMLFCRRTTSPRDAPLESFATEVAPGMLLRTPVTDADRVMMTPEAAIKTPRTIGIAIELVCKPGELKTLDPADSDMKQPRKYVLPVGPAPLPF